MKHACRLLALTLLADALFAPHALGKDQDASAPLQVRAKLIHRTKTPGAKEIAPYREALSVFEYKVLEVTRGKLDDQSIRVSHWTVFDGVHQNLRKPKVGDVVQLHLTPADQLPQLAQVMQIEPDDGDPTLPQFHDVRQALLRSDEIGGRDYGKTSSARMKTLLALRGQLKLVAWGDSRTYEGVLAKQFYGRQNQLAPVAYNIAEGSAPLPMFYALSEGYFKHMPNLRWVVAGIAPRMLNLNYSGGRDHPLASTKGYQRDVAAGKKLWAPSASVLTTAQLERINDLGWRDLPWGSRAKDGVYTGGPDTTASPQWRLDVRNYIHLRATIDDLAQRGIHVLIFTPPSPPVYRKTAYVDEDATPRDAYRKHFIPMLEKLAQAHRQVWLVDINQAGQHDFEAELFRDRDHLNTQGAARLSAMLETFRKKHERSLQRVAPQAKPLGKPKPIQISDTTKGLAWAQLAPGVKRYVDRSHTYKQVPNGLRGLAVLQTRNDDKRAAADEPLVRFKVNQPVRLYIVIKPNAPLPQWMIDYKPMPALKFDGYELYYRDHAAGEIALHGGGDLKDNYTVIVRSR